MKIDLRTLNKDLLIKEQIEIPEEYYKNTDVKKLKNVDVEGKIYYNLSNEIAADLKVRGLMVLEDAYTLDLIDYPFTIEINEILDKNVENYKISQNILDLNELLWENIVLEIPISLTKSPNKVLSGDGWTLNGQDKEGDSPLKDLNNLFKGGE